MRALGKVVFAAAISACEKGGAWARALALLAAMIGANTAQAPLGLPAPDSVCFAAAAAACAGSGRWAHALAVVASARAASVAMDTV